MTRRRPARKITRRDFLDGAAIGAAALLARSRATAAPGSPASLAPGPSPAPSPAAPYPPALTGLRGSHDGAFEAAHRLKDGEFWDHAGAPTETGETYDLIVVGSGLSGLTAALLYREAAGPKARVLLLDNHDDFGGHARRNEFTHAGRTFLSYGGSYAVDSPGAWSAVAKGVLSRLGLDVARGDKILDRKLYASMGLSRGVFLDRETFGRDALLPDPLGDFGGEADDDRPPGDPWPRFLAGAPLSQQARDDLVRLCRHATDYMPGLTSAQKKERLARMTYRDFLRNFAKIDDGALKFLQARTHSLAGVGIDGYPAQDAWGIGLPGFDGLALDPTPGPGMDRDAMPHETERYFFHFPDGNASIARLMVRALIPDAVPGSTYEDVLTTRTRYDRLDQPSSPVRIRLGSTAVRVRHEGDPATAKEVAVTYARGRELATVRAPNVILACWNMVIPHLCPDLPEPQREALAYGTKVPLIYSSVLIRNWTAWKKLGYSAIHAPGSYHVNVNLGRPVSLGSYQCPVTPEEPIVLHMVRTPNMPGLPPRQQHKAGRLELLQTPFTTFESKIRDQLARMLSPGGFDAARDILAITVNRWSHGYPYQYTSLYDPFWIAGKDLPCDRARKPFGRISIANADAAAYSYADAAMDQADRAVREVLARR